MTKGIKATREAIKQRKKKRHVSKNESISNIPYLASDEEKHGFYLTPSIDDAKPSVVKQKKVNAYVTRKLIGAIGLFIVMFGLLQTNINMFDTPKEWLEVSLQEEFPFAKIADKYVALFGTPLALVPSKTDSVTVQTTEPNLPVFGDVVETFAVNGKGIMISPKETASVTALDKGVVIFAGNDRKTDKTVIIQHADNSKTVYGHLSSLDVFLYQYVQANDVIGSFEPTVDSKNVYFSIVKEKEFLDPAEVIFHDEAP